MKGLKLKKSLGQHLLISKGVLKKIAEFAGHTTQDTVVEVGPGTGNLTEVILGCAPKKLYLLEIDEEMIETLRERFRDEIEEGRVEIIKADAGTFDYGSLEQTELKLLGNLPYNRASAIVERVVLSYEWVSSALFMVQKEVAERWMGIESWLSVFVQTFFDVEYLMTVPPRFFIPKPKVDSAVIRLTRRIKARITDLRDYKDFLVKVFANKRKCLRNKLSSEVLEKAHISPKLRVEKLELIDFFRLYQALLNSQKA